MVARDDWQNQVAAVIADYEAHTALYDYYFRNRPNGAQFQALDRIKGEFQRLVLGERQFETY